MSVRTTNLQSQKTNGALYFRLVALACLLLKLFVASGVAINPIWAPADYTNFLDHARGILKGE